MSKSKKREKKNKTKKTKEFERVHTEVLLIMEFKIREAKFTKKEFLRTRFHDMQQRIKKSGDERFNFFSTAG